MKGAIVIGSFLLLPFFLCLQFNPVEVGASNGYKVHNLSTGLNYTTIQGAIDALETLNGHTIAVDAGVYDENVVVSKSLKLVGENEATTIIDGNGTGNVVYVTAHNVTVMGFTVRNSGTAQWNSGIRFNQCDNGTVIGNTVLNCDNGIRLMYCNNCSIKGNYIDEPPVLHYGIVALSSNYCTIENNTAMNTGHGIRWDLSSHLRIRGNILRNNSQGIAIVNVDHSLIIENTVINSSQYGAAFGQASTNNTLFHNNFINNTQQIAMTEGSGNFVWNNDLEGNYWSNYTGIDSNHNGIGDMSHTVLGNNVDNYPLMGMFSSFDAAPGYQVQITCNSTISGFLFNGTAITFNVSGEESTDGFCRIYVPTALMNGTYRAFVNGTEVSCNPLQCSNITHSYLYFNYTHSTREVVITPEFPPILFLPLFIIATLMAVVVYRKKHIGIR